MDRTDFEPWKGREVAKLLALVENQRRYYQDMVSGLPVGLVVLSSNRSVVLANRAFRHAFGLRVEDLQGKTIEHILPSDRLIEKIRDVMMHGSPQQGIQPGFELEQAGRTLSISILPLRNWDEETEMQTLLVIADVTNVRAGSGALAEAAARATDTRKLSAFPLENLPAIVWQADAGRPRFTAVSGAVEEMLGYPVSHWLKSPQFFGERIHAGDRDAVLALYRTAVEQSREVSAEFRAVTASGEAIWCRETVRLTETGALGGVLSRMGQRKTLEQLQITAERNSALHGLSARLAHDLNNPLMIISGYAEEMLQPMAADDKRRGDLEQILAATERIGSLTGQLLQFTRKQARPAELIELTAMMAGLGEKIEVRGVRPVWAMANRQQLEEILGALVSAASEDSQTRTPVTITCDTAAILEQTAGASLAPGTYARVTLAVGGRAMDAEKRKAIFESFLQKESDKLSGGALARAYAIVREWGGELGFESEAPTGFTFTLYLPLAEPAPPSGPPATKPATPRSAAERLRETILVVDDEAGIRALIVKILRRERYRVLEAGGTAEAVAVAANHDGPIHLLVTDVMLPDRSGRELAKELLDTLPGLKVMYISGFTDDESVRSGAFPQGARFLQKPFTLGALMGTVREALDQ